MIAPWDGQLRRISLSARASRAFSQGARRLAADSVTTYGALDAHRTKHFYQQTGPVVSQQRIPGTDRDAASFAERHCAR
jgi:hypothetical protein